MAPPRRTAVSDAWVIVLETRSPRRLHAGSCGCCLLLFFLQRPAYFYYCIKYYDYYCGCCYSRYCCYPVSSISTAASFISTVPSLLVSSISTVTIVAPVGSLPGIFFFYFYICWCYWCYYSSTTITITNIIIITTTYSNQVVPNVNLNLLQMLPTYCTAWR